MSYFDLAKNKFEIKSDEELTKIFNKFVESSPSIHPLALGNVNRTHNLIKILAKRLLKSHKEQIKEDEVEKIIDFLTEKLYSHQYFFGRKEAKEELGIKNVVYADQKLSDFMTEIYDEYNNEMQMTKIWNPEIEFGKGQNQNYKIAYVESLETSNCFEINMEFKKVQQNISQQTPAGIINIPQEQIVWRMIGQGWK
jgi:hypothetical protein